MSLNSASNPQQVQPKRQQTDPTAVSPSEPANATSPSAATMTPKATACATLATSVATLLPVLNPILTDIENQFIDLLHRRYNKQRQFDRITADMDAIPRSARIDALTTPNEFMRAVQ